jgi:trans-2,3-dihydro-3-hydroxyanthranilate isomerase
VIRERLLDARAERVVLDLAVGPIPVAPTSRDGVEVLWMRQNAPRFGARVEPATAAAALALPPEDVDPDLPCEVVSTGIPFLIVPLTSLDALRRCRIAPAAYETLGAAAGTTDVLVLARSGRDPSHALSVRVFAPAHGVPEDPATGSANGCLAGWLCRHHVLGSDAVEVTVGQGHEIGRPSRLHLRAWAEAGHVAVEVGGQVAPVAEGRLLP